MLISCSSGKSPLEPSANDAWQDQPSATSSANRETIAVYDVTIDEVSQTCTIEPSERETSFHYALSQTYPSTLQITGYGFTPNFWADIKLTHPYPGSGVDFFDPRLIVIVPANAGVRFQCLSLAIFGNDKAVLEPDGYTKLFDSVGGSILGNVNPFLAYFKTQPNRRWSSAGPTSETRRVNMSLPGFGGPLTYKLVVDVSTTYPNPPQIGISNAQEPVQIEATVGQPLTPDGSSVTLTATLLDWQGRSGISLVAAEAPALFSGVKLLNYVGTGPNPNEYVFSVQITNSLHAPIGTYNMIIGARDQATGVDIYDEFPVTVSNDINFDIKDVTPGSLLWHPDEIALDGDYMYVIDTDYGLSSYDITDPLAPKWLTRISLPDTGNEICIKDDYAYVACSFNGLLIVDISNPMSFEIVHSVAPGNWASDVFISGNYAFMADSSAGVRVIDITVPESASVIKTIAVTGYCYGVCVSGNYMYAVGYNAGFQAFDITDIMNPELIKTLLDNEWTKEVAVDGNYVYVAMDGYLRIFDVTDPENAYEVKTVAQSGTPQSLFVQNGYAYTSNNPWGYYIVDVDPPSSAFVEKRITPAYYAMEFFPDGNGLAYGSDNYDGITVLDIDPVASASIVSSVKRLVQPALTYVLDDYAYVVDGMDGLKIVDISTPESAFVAKSINLGYIHNVCAANGYVYVGDTDTMQIWDVDPLESAHFVNTIELPGSYWDMDVANGYVFIAHTSSGVYILDVDPPESLSMLKVLETTDGGALSLEYADGYLYVTCGSYLDIFDVDPIASSYKVFSVELDGYSRKIDFADGYAYLTLTRGMTIVDVDPLPSSHTVKTIEVSGEVRDVSVSGGYAYFGDGEYGIRIVDITPPETASIVDGIEFEDPQASGSTVTVVDNYAYSCEDGWWKIYKLY